MSLSPPFYRRIGFKLAVTLVCCLAVILGLTSYSLIVKRKQALEQELFAKGQMAAQVGAETMSRFIEELLEAKTFTREQLFDVDYQLITAGELAGSEIPKYHTAYDRYFDWRIQHVEDAFLDDPMVVYAVLVDRNGYLPTHNRRYSKPLTGDPAVDRSGNRTKRIFNDPVGLAAAHYQGFGDGKVLKQVYPRDTGVMMWDLSAPVMVNGEHWGAFRIGFSMEQIEASIAELRNTVLLSSVGALIACALLVMLVVSKFTRPLLQLTEAVKALASGQRGERIELRSNDEVGVLVESFNRMRENLDQTTVSRDFYDRLLQSMHDLLIVTDPQGAILSVNRATCAVLDYTEEHVCTHKIQDLVSLTDDESDWFQEQLGGRLNFTADVVMVNCDKLSFPMAMSSSPLFDQQDQLTGYIFTFQDNRQRIEAEQEKERAYDEMARINSRLQQVNSEMETKNAELGGAYKQLKNSQVQILQQEKMASIGQLAAGVAHEINNPIGFITSNLGSLGKYLERLHGFISRQDELIRDKVEVEETAELKAERKNLKIDYLLEDSRDLIEESLDGANRVKVIVQNLKSFSRVDQQQQQNADLNSCLEDTISIAWNELKYKVTLEKDYGELPLLYCFPQQLNQVFLNLLVNAAHAIEEKGIIRVRTWHEADEICVAISDTGCGIPEENLQRIFEPFFTTKEVGKGTGLGMSISYDIVTAHHGTIEVASELGQGSCFTIRLPLTSEPSTEEPA